MTERIGYINRSNNKLWLHKRYDSELDDYAYASDFIDYYHPTNNYGTEIGNVRRIFSFSTGKSIIYYANEEFKVIDDAYTNREVVKTWSEMFDEHQQVYQLNLDNNSPTKFGGYYTDNGGWFQLSHLCYQSWDNRFYEARLVDYDWDKLYPWENHFGLLVRSSGVLKVATVLNVFDHNKKAIRVNVNFLEGFFIYKDGSGSKVVPELEYLNEFGEKWYLTIQDGAFVASSKQRESKNPIQTLRYATWQKTDEQFSTSTIKTAQASKLPLAKGLADENHKNWCEDQFFKVLRPQNLVILHKNESGEPLFASSDFNYLNPANDTFQTAPIFSDKPKVDGPFTYHHTRYYLTKDPVKFTCECWENNNNLVYKDGGGNVATRIPMEDGKEDFSYKGWDGRIYRAQTLKYAMQCLDRGYVAVHRSLKDLSTIIHCTGWVDLFSWRSTRFRISFDIPKNVFYYEGHTNKPLLGIHYKSSEDEKVKGELFNGGILWASARRPWDKKYSKDLEYIPVEDRDRSPYNTKFIPYIYSIIGDS